MTTTVPKDLGIELCKVLGLPESCAVPNELNADRILTRYNGQAFKDRVGIEIVRGAYNGFDHDADAQLERKTYASYPTMYEAVINSIGIKLKFVDSESSAKKG